VANIELRKSFLGDRVVGHIDSPGLSWSDHHALSDAARASHSVAMESSAIRQRLESVNLSVAAVGRAVMAMEYQLGFRLQAVADALAQQLTVLQSIEQSLKTPAKTRAAERLDDVGELLRRQRWQRALAVAESAIEDDPNNPAGFLAAGWAQMGLGDLQGAKDAFVEAADASDGVARSAAGRQASRLALALQDSQTALASLDRYGVTSASVWPEHIRWEGARTAAVVHDWWEQRLELAAVHYDRAVYLASTDTRESALELEDAGAIDPRSYALALADKLLGEHPQLIGLAVEKLESAVVEQKATFEAHLTSVQRALERRVDFESQPPEFEHAGKLGRELAEALANETIHDPSWIRLNSLFLDRLERVVAKLDADEAIDLQRIIEEDARSLAAKHPGRIARPSPDGTVTVYGVTLRTWVVEQPRSGLMRVSRIWLVSTDGMESTITRTR
jgi:tetratricopeptide (TPR) repeat protein